MGGRDTRKSSEPAHAVTISHDRGFAVYPTQGPPLVPATPPAGALPNDSDFGGIVGQPRKLLGSDGYADVRRGAEEWLAFARWFISGFGICPAVSIKSMTRLGRLAKPTSRISNAVSARREPDARRER